MELSVSNLQFKLFVWFVHHPVIRGVVNAVYDGVGKDIWTINVEVNHRFSCHFFLSSGVAGLRFIKNVGLLTLLDLPLTSR